MWCIPHFSKRGHNEDIMTLQMIMSHLKMVMLLWGGGDENPSDSMPRSATISEDIIFKMIKS